MDKNIKNIALQVKSISSEQWESMQSYLENNSAYCLQTDKTFPVMTKVKISSNKHSVCRKIRVS